MVRLNTSRAKTITAKDIESFKPDYKGCEHDHLVGTAGEELQRLYCLFVKTAKLAQIAEKLKLFGLFFGLHAFIVSQNLWGKST